MTVFSRTFVRSTLGLLTAGAIALLAIVGASLWLVDRTQDYADGVVAAREMRSAVADLRSDLQDAETGQRGYLLTQDSTYLEPYNSARSGIRTRLERVRRLGGAYADMSPLLDELTRTVDGKLAELDRTIQLQAAGRREEVLALINSDVGKTLMGRAREIFDELILQADLRLNGRIESQRSSAAALQWVTSLGGLAILFVVGGSAWVIVRYTRDLTQARAAVEALNVGLEERVHERTSDLRRANDEIQRFAYIVTHDLRAPLVNIMGFTSELETSLAPIQALVSKAELGDAQDVRNARAVAQEDLPEAIGFIRSSTRKMDGLINAILKLSRDGRRPLKPERLDLNALLRAAVDTVQHQIAEAGGEVEFGIGVPSIVSDRVSLEQIVGNLLDNAVKYRDRQRPLRLAIRTSPASAGRVKLDVEDNGRGIARQDHERVFDLFRRSGAQDQAGEGIGLAHVRSSVRNLGGDITVASELGQGTTFTLSLPRNLAAVIRSGAA